MTTHLFVNIPVKDLAASTAFFTALGFDFDTRFADDNMTAMNVNDHAQVLLHTEPYFSTFTDRAIADTGRWVEAILTVSADTRAAVDELVDAAIVNGAKAAQTKDLGFVYTRGFHDLDGHLWEVTYIDMDAAAAQ